MARNRKTRIEMIAFRQAQLDKLVAQEEGSYQDASENAVLKALSKRLRRTNTLLSGFQISLNGNGVRSSIADKILGTRKRLAAQIETQENAERYAAALPFDVERLEALVAAGKAGEEVEMPSDLTPFPDEQERTDEEHEAAFIASEEADPED